MSTENGNLNFDTTFVAKYVRPLFPVSIYIKGKKVYRKIKSYSYRNWPVIRDLREIQSTLSFIRHYTGEAQERRHQDIVEIMKQIGFVIGTPGLSVDTEYPVAHQSADHLFPEGTAVDNTKNMAFTQRCEQHFGRKISYLDIGCSGGGLVFDALMKGNLAVGIEGSDFSQKRERAEWRTIPENLFTADISKEFIVKHGGSRVKFDVISAWEVLEHIDEQDLDTVFNNVTNHMNGGSIFIGSIGSAPSFHQKTGTPLHVTLKTCEWWISRMGEYRLEEFDDHEFKFSDYCRGVANGPCDPDYSEPNPIGYHFIVRKK